MIMLWKYHFDCSKNIIFPQGYQQRLLICIDGQYAVGVLLFILIL